MRGRPDFQEEATNIRREDKMLRNLLLAICLSVIGFIAFLHWPEEVRETTIQQDQAQGAVEEISDPELATICRAVQTVDRRITKGGQAENQEILEALRKLHDLTQIPVERKRGVECGYKQDNGKYYWPMDEDWRIEAKRRWLLQQLLLNFKRYLFIGKNSK